MNILTLIVIASWATFIIFWAATSVGVKRDIGSGMWSRWRRSIIARLVVAAIILSILKFSGVGSATYRTGTFSHWIISGNSILLVIGTVLCVLGIALAVWARVYLGRNWSPAPAIKEGHELVTSGPYATVRHPIYTGIMAATLGSALVSPVWFIMFIFMSVMFILRVKKEERLMLSQFPNQYPDYMKRTWALIPFIY